MNLRIKAGVDNFHDVRMMSHKDIALLARSLEIDIAIDLCGYTAHNRAEVFAMSAAPIQVSYLGFPSTMGSNFMDYIIADRTVIPEDKQVHYSEKIAYMPNCYMVNDSKITVSKKIINKTDAGLPSDSFVFCCFNNFYKINPIVFKSWMNILSKVSGSILWLPEGNSIAMNNLKKEFKKHGIDENRLFFAPRLTLKEDHLNRLQLADLFIDTFPFNAHTTCSDALRVGLPVLTCIGDSFTSRVASSQLNSMNLPELITTSPKHYESLAIKLATDAEKLRVIKEKLEKNSKTSTLYNTQLYTKQLETVYLDIYNKSQKEIRIYL
jgi:predicted O-linked N-acetylglucosamine transferase (SPINDLY family)